VTDKNHRVFVQRHPVASCFKSVETQVPNHEKCIYGHVSVRTEDKLMQILSALSSSSARKNN